MSAEHDSCLTTSFTHDSDLVELDERSVQVCQLTKDAMLAIPRTDAPARGQTHEGIDLVVAEAFAQESRAEIEVGREPLNILQHLPDSRVSVR